MIILSFRFNWVWIWQNSNIFSC